MRTKTLLLGVAALAFGIYSSQAQNVYSQNVVGYVNVIVPQAPAWACAANPFDLDGVDNITNVLANAPKGTTVELFSPATGFSTIVTRSAINGSWSAAAATTFIPPGVGFMIKCTTAYTNTFVGNVIPNSGGTNSLPLSALTLQLIGSPTPYSGTLTNASDNGANSLNLGATLPKNTQIQTYNNGFTLAATKSAINGTWNANPTLMPGQGFFVKPGSATNWQQTLP
ncbi:MAG TPA: hypothetical protein VGM58_01145 [Verrucomicrobiae bacterium]|jgi:hypothetical protein